MESKPQLLIISLLIFCNLSFGQQFYYHSDSPFNIDLTAENKEAQSFRMIFKDHDQDGDLDLFHVGFSVDTSQLINIFNFTYVFDYQENIGTSQSPDFGERIPAFENFNYPFGFFIPSLGDLNNDGKLDIIVASKIDTFSEQQHLLFYQNEFSINPDQFKIELADEYDLDPIMPRSFLIPELVDIDSDGDLDILLSGFTPTDINYEEFKPITLFAKNTGTNVRAEYLGWFDYPYNISKEIEPEFIKAADIDNDGDLDLISSALVNDKSLLSYRENTSNDLLVPHFSKPISSPFGLPEFDENSGILDFNFVDLDKDGDQDLMLLVIVEENIYVRFYENDMCINSSQELNINICEGDEYEGYHESGTYIDHFMDSSGCDSNRILNLIVNPSFRIELEEQLCENETFTIADQNFSEAGNYMIELLTNEGCDSIIQLDLSYELLDVSIIQEGNALTSVQDEAQYQWFNCDNGNNIIGQNMQSFVSNQSGSYAVEITSSNNCIGISECYEIIISSTSDHTSSKKIEIFPNPGSGFLYITTLDNQIIKSIRLFDYSGSKVKTWTNCNKPSFNLEGIRPGSYILVISLDKTEVVTKISIF